MSELVVAAVDVGAVRNIGYWRDSADGSGGGTKLEELATQVAADLDLGRRVALGFEAPLFVPMPDDSDALNRQRTGERGRPWCAGAGTGALAMGAQQATWLLSQIARSAQGRPLVTVDCDEFARTGGLLLWEAFVSAAGKDRSALDPHIDDARRAVRECRSRLSGPAPLSDITDSSVFSLIGAAALAAGLSDDLNLLSQPCLVVRVPDLA